MVHIELPSLHAILKESPSEDDSASSDGGSSSFPVSQDCNVVTSAVPIVTTPPLEATLTLQTIPTVPQQAAVSQPDTELLPERLWANQEEQQCALLTDIEHRAMQRQGKLTCE
jgi:hypothetical protein